MQTTFLDKADLERLAADFNALLHDYPEWRREMYEEMGRAVLEDVQRGFGNGEVAGWQDAVVGSGGGYAAVRAKKETFTQNGERGKPYAVGYVTNAIDSGHKQGKGRFVPGLKPQSWRSEKQPYGARLKADRVAGKGVYAGARQRAERIAYQATERFVRKIQQKLKEG